MEIRLADPTDLELLCRPHEDVFDNPVRREWAEEFLNDPRYHLVVAIHRDQVIGFVSAIDYIHPDKPRELFMIEVSVAGPHRREGVGKEMMRAMLRHAKKIGCEVAWVQTEENNLPARALYESFTGDLFDEGISMYTYDPRHEID